MARTSLALSLLGLILALDGSAAHADPESRDQRSKRPRAQPENKPDNRPDNKPDNRPAARPERSPESRPAPAPAQPAQPAQPDRPVVRDHRREAPPPAEPTVRDHRGGDAPPAQPGQPVVRDHRGGADVRVHVEPPATQTIVVRHRGAPTTTYVQGGSTVHYHPGPPGPGFMLPMRLEVGNLSGPTDRGYLGGSSLRLGLHWASLSPRSVTYDVGVGLQLGWLLGPAEQAMSPDTKNVSMLGLYVEGAKVLHKGRFWRTWAGARGEYFARDAFGEDATGYGLAGRVSAELFADDSNSRSHGLFLGSYGFGMYLEANVRQLGDEVSPVQIGIGLTFRTPMVVL